MQLLVVRNKPSSFTESAQAIHKAVQKMKKKMLSIKPVQILLHVTSYMKKSKSNVPIQDSHRNNVMRDVLHAPDRLAVSTDLVENIG
ncbi:hypothetical protein SLE2022_335010 [Rubroshorea leprosula]